ncbi:hypothetical protein MKW98_013748 [Papaver atlanticum]|uniref:Uncharacterized protein n=1 Tax=Papaver atlanticum TaxID=357466 RepID=A0AAD4S837_9MAGN|nr:hypothetical protein MKW98_013748 [Papaver atlanticum]
MQQMMKPYPTTQITRSRPIKEYWEELDFSTNDVTSIKVAFVNEQLWKRIIHTGAAITLAQVLEFKTTTTYYSTR